MTEQRTFWIGAKVLPRKGRFSLVRPRIDEIRSGGEAGPVVLTCGHIRRSTRRAEHVLDGPLAGGNVLHRRRITRFELVGPDGSTLASYRQRALRPGRNWRPSWEITSPTTSDPVVVTEDATFVTTKHLRAELRGDPTVHHHAPGLESTGYPNHATVTLTGEAPLPDVVMLLAALIAHRTHQPADLD